MNTEEITEALSSMKKADHYFELGKSIVRDNIEIGAISFGIADNKSSTFDRGRSVVALIGYMDERIRMLEDNVNNLANLIADKA